MPPLTMKPMELSEEEASVALIVDTSETFQEILGFGGAFTEAAALNWRSLSEADQAEVIRRYFASPAEGGLGYTVGRVPIGSCDFGPGNKLRYYNLDDVAGDVELEHFDDESGNTRRTHTNPHLSPRPPPGSEKSKSRKVEM